MNHSANLGQNIRTAREAKDITQLELAHQIGMSGLNAGSYISRAENGIIVPRIDTLSKIAKVLETDVHQLIPRMG